MRTAAIDRRPKGKARDLALRKESQCVRNIVLTATSIMRPMRLSRHVTIVASGIGCRKRPPAAAARTKRSRRRRCPACTSDETSTGTGSARESSETGNDQVSRIATAGNAVSRDVEQPLVGSAGKVNSCTAQCAETGCRKTCTAHVRGSHDITHRRNITSLRPEMI